LYVNGGIMLAILAACFAVRRRLTNFEEKLISENQFLL